MRQLEFCLTRDTKSGLRTSTSAFHAAAHSAPMSLVPATESMRLPSSEKAVNDEGGIICKTCDWHRDRTRFSSSERQS